MHTTIHEVYGKRIPWEVSLVQGFVVFVMKPSLDDASSLIRLSQHQEMNDRYCSTILSVRDVLQDVVNYTTERRETITTGVP